jgi:hypothetical protein
MSGIGSWLGDDPIAGASRRCADNLKFQRASARCTPTTVERVRIVVSAFAAEHLETAMRITTRLVLPFVAALALGTASAAIADNGVSPIGGNSTTPAAGSATTQVAKSTAKGKKSKKSKHAKSKKKTGGSKGQGKH